PVQQALVAEQAIQCGFCTPGIAIAAAALLARNADPDEAAIKAAVPNLCRCGVYPRLVRAIQRAEGNFDCFGSARSGHCSQDDCLWRQDCLRSV
ncbi:MAG: 2Fe-2S iron-sulfur cluster-binding protein, partial [Nitrospiraceae bacterium]|nr:2Fe-2S iron-sulfur cluster-binding protein [Nitrospiraceae bacterium]